MLQEELRRGGEQERERERELQGDELERWEYLKVVFYINKSSIYRENKR